MVFYVAQVLGCFCQIDRYGKLVLKRYGNESVWNVEQKERFDSSYSDFVTRYTAVSSTNQISQTAEYIAMEKDDALTTSRSISHWNAAVVSSVAVKSISITFIRDCPISNGATLTKL